MFCLRNYSYNGSTITILSLSVSAENNGGGSSNHYNGTKGDDDSGTTKVAIFVGGAIAGVIIIAVVVIVVIIAVVCLRYVLLSLCRYFRNYRCQWLCIICNSYTCVNNILTSHTIL